MKIDSSLNTNKLQKKFFKFAKSGKSLGDEKNIIKIRILKEATSKLFIFVVIIFNGKKIY